MNRIPIFLPLHLDWFQMFSILAFLFYSFNDYDVIPACHQLEENAFPHSTYEEDDSFVQSIIQAIQIDLSLFFTHQGSFILINPFDHGYYSNNCLPIDQFPT